MPDDLIIKLIEAVARLEQSGLAMETRMNSFQSEMDKIAVTLDKTADSLTKIRNIMVLVVVAIAASGIDANINVGKILKLLGV